MVHSEVYLNKYVVSIAPISTIAFTPTPTPFRKLLFVACFRFLIFHPFFQGGSADPICPYVRTPMLRISTAKNCPSVETYGFLRSHKEHLDRFDRFYTADARDQQRRVQTTPLHVQQLAASCAMRCDAA